MVEKIKIYIYFFSIKCLDFSINVILGQFVKQVNTYISVKQLAAT